MILPDHEAQKTHAALRLFTVEVCVALFFFLLQMGHVIPLALIS